MGNDLVLLMECANGIEAAHVRSLLTGEGIEHVVQGEHHSNLLGGTTLPAAILPRVLVHERDAERAKALLEAAPTLAGAEGDPLEGALCPVHEQWARATCGRCGTFLCASCQTLGEPPICEACVDAEKNPPRRGFPALIMLGIPVALLIGVGLLMHYLGVVPD
ncbi:MAG: hypothetical protein DI536_08755 [Archangium gephyra]|uniref:DUF2007 domain-containing protein n=1 Tax=Archangium gephyra TaxID=48 RepID=A0A2W5TIW6_9BACT|nr:MAG: hypothetical protein DI536_08755 [Archangium gephyra]